MAIKVKHEGNVTSRAVAGAIGGQARRNAEDSKALSQRAAQENMAANRQLNGAHASPASPGHASAQLGHAPSLSAHAPTPTLATARMMNPILAERAETQQALADKSMEGRLRLQGEIADQRMREEYALRAQRGDIEALRKMQEWDRQHGILRQERDADLIAAGTHEYGFSPEVQRQADKLQKEYDEGLASGKWTEAEQTRFKAQLDQQLAALPKTLVQRKDPEGLFRNNTFTDEQGRIFSTDGKLLYDPAEAETRQREYQMKMQDMEDKRYMDALMKLEQGYRATDPIYKTDPMGELAKDDSGNPIIERYNSVYKPYTEEQKQAILQRLFPNRFANVQPGSAGAQPAPASANPYPIDLVTGFNSPEMEAMRGQLAQPIAQPTAQTSTAANEPEWKKKLGW